MSTTQQKLMTNWRWWLCSLLFVATTVNYLDRQVLSLTYEELITPEFHLTDAHYGTITSFFSIFYRSAACSPANSWTGWARRKATSSPSASGRSAHACTPCAAGAPPS